MPIDSLNTWEESIAFGEGVKQRLATSILIHCQAIIAVRALEICQDFLRFQ